MRRAKDGWNLRPSFREAVPAMSDRTGSADKGSERAFEVEERRDTKKERNNSQNFLEKICYLYKIL